MGSGFILKFQVSTSVFVSLVPIVSWCACYLLKMGKEERGGKGFDDKVQSIKAGGLPGHGQPREGARIECQRHWEPPRAVSHAGEEALPLASLLVSVCFS